MAEQSKGLNVFRHEHGYWVVDAIWMDGSHRRVYGRIKREAMQNFYDALSTSHTKLLSKVQEKNALTTYQS